MVALFEKGREGFADGTVDWDTHTIKAALFDLSGTDTGVRPVTGATNATPIVITATGHTFTNGDIVMVDAVGGNSAANGLWKIANVAAGTFELQRPDGTNATGSGAYTSGGYVVCLGPSGAGDNLDDFSATRVTGSTDQTLANKTATSGVLDADNITYPSVPSGATVHAVALYKDTADETTSRMILLHTGKHVVTCAAVAAAAATTMAVEPLAAGVANGAVLAFSNGASVTLSAAANAGDRTLTVTALAAQVTAGNRALATASGSGFPLPTNGGAISVNWSDGANKIAKL